LDTVSRQQIIDGLSAALEGETFVLAAWLGGSDATGRTDRFSDVDFCVLAEDGRTEDTLAAAERAAAALGPVAARYRLPEPTWHGASQVFLRLGNADPHHFVDLCVLERSRRELFGEGERHGQPLVLFDPEGLVEVTSLDWPAHVKRMAARMDTLRAMAALFQPLVTRAVARGFGAEAFQDYQQFTLKPLIELARMRHCPERFDFGVRYLDRDLPADRRAEIEELAYPGNARELLRFHERAAARVAEELDAFDRGEWSLPPVDDGVPTG